MKSRKSKGVCASDIYIHKKKLFLQSCYDMFQRNQAHNWSLKRRLQQRWAHAARRCAASSSASSRFSLISASVRTKRVHSSFRGTATCWGGGDGTKEAWLKLPVQVSDRKCYLHARVEEVKESHLPNLVDENSSIRVSHCDFSARMPPSEFIKGWITVYYHTGSGHLKQQQRRSD